MTHRPFTIYNPPIYEPSEFAYFPLATRSNCLPFMYKKKDPYSYPDILNIPQDSPYVDFLILIDHFNILNDDVKQYYIPFYYKLRSTQIENVYFLNSEFVDQLVFKDTYANMNPTDQMNYDVIFYMKYILDTIEFIKIPMRDYRSFAIYKYVYLEGLNDFINLTTAKRTIPIEQMDYKTKLGYYFSNKYRNLHALNTWGEYYGNIVLKQHPPDPYYAQADPSRSPHSSLTRSLSTPISTSTTEFF